MMEFLTVLFCFGGPVLIIGLLVLWSKEIKAFLDRIFSFKWFRAKISGRRAAERAVKSWIKRLDEDILRRSGNGGTCLVEDGIPQSAIRTISAYYRDVRKFQVECDTSTGRSLVRLTISW